MELVVERNWKKTNYTIGNFFINGKKICNSLEDRDRGLTQSMSLESIKRIKQFGETAIPTGTYNVRITYSPKYKRDMPLIENVKGFDGIRIHSGNTPKDTLGCLLLGKNTEVGKITQSRATCEIVYKEIQNALDRGEKVTLTIR